jgi:hypothetical protein
VAPAPATPRRRPRRSGSTASKSSRRSSNRGRASKSGAATTKTQPTRSPSSTTPSTSKPAAKARTGSKGTSKKASSSGDATKAQAKKRKESTEAPGVGGHRWWPQYDSERPHVRLGFLWFVVVLVSLVGGAPAVAVPYAVAAALGAAQAVKAWRRVGQRPHLAAAVGTASAMPLATAVTSRGAGAAILIGAAASVLVIPGSVRVLLRDAGCTIRCWLPAGLAAASVVAVARLDIGAAVALVILVSAYDCGDYVVGADARWPIIGTLAGAAAVGVLSFSLYVVALPPFGGPPVFVFGAALALLAPLGQIAASFSLPDGRLLASGLRRLDTLVLAGPAWVALLTWYPLD